jgi:hypothetical protein
MEEVAAPPPKSTPKVYMTPHLAKRKDGLCPSLLQNHSSAKPVKDKPGHTYKPYQTNSKLLLQIKDRDGVPREVNELQTLIDVVNKSLKAHIALESDPTVEGLKFKPEGCVWKMEFHSSFEEACDDYRMEVICSANESEQEGTIYVIDCIMIPKKAVDPSPLVPPLPGFKDAKIAYDKVMFSVRKAVVRLEFPDFPEGCKGKAFKEVYQLNARVRQDPS